jgi:hypothetical protein
MIEFQFFAYWIRLQGHVLRLSNNYRQFAISYLSYNPDDTSDPLNLIKICPYCSEVWIKVSGCDNETKCGNIGE